eukprot:scaffold31928_cov62-Phaeocystis_antarctica.AAC.3
MTYPRTGPRTTRPFPCATVGLERLGLEELHAESGFNFDDTWRTSRTRCELGCGGKTRLDKGLLVLGGAKCDGVLRSFSPSVREPAIDPASSSATLLQALSR